MRLVAIAVLLFLSLTVSGNALGYWDEYGPFEKGEHPKYFPIKECRMTQNGRIFEIPENFDFYNKDILYISSTGRKIRVWRNSREDPIIRFSLIDGEKVIIDNYEIGPGFGPSYTYSGDLNNDGIEDYVIEGLGPHQGIGEGIRYVAFVLSFKKGYKVKVIENFFPDKNDFININGNCFYIFTFLTGGNGHSFWVYTLLEIRDGELKVSTVDKRFPKFIQYTFKNNHKETDKLSPKKKKEIWEKEFPPIFENAR